MAEESVFSFLGASAKSQAAAISAQAKALAVDYETISGYKKVVDELLTKLGNSEASDKKLAHTTLPEGTLGTGFAEAVDLFDAYKTVQKELENLSKGLAGHIEALGLAIQTAGKSFTEVDYETKRRLAAIAKQAKDAYVEARDPLVKEQKAHEAQQAPAGEANKPKGNI
ncbi:hypothetical protein [Streptomyces sp. WAC05292]|uniref:hypothetical protein n=1 Tax=Streptomyces sp. WAC05292 TaxID=2487418 RepID=UPI0021AEFE1B|nr:hypothetical protein [Streptomyces sp. WAC05292]